MMISEIQVCIENIMILLFGLFIVPQGINAEASRQLGGPTLVANEGASGANATEPETDLRLKRTLPTGRSERHVQVLRPLYRDLGFAEEHYS